MVEPIGFRTNPETSDDNMFQSPAREDTVGEVEGEAHAEFDGLRRALEGAGVEVVAFRPDRSDTPDAVFPNNWFSTHPEGVAFLYPMRSRSRRNERSRQIVSYLQKRYPKIVDLTGEESRGRFLEGTGSLVIDERARTVYASESKRTDPALVRSWCERMDFEPEIFRARDGSGRDIYHTNVVLSIGHDFAIVCLEAIDPSDRERVRERLEDGGRALIVISNDQLHDFCGNVLGLTGIRDEPVVVMSRRAEQAFGSAAREAIARHARIVSVPLNAIERHGGGSARCMLAELN